MKHETCDWCLTAISVFRATTFIDTSAATAYGMVEVMICIPHGPGGGYSIDLYEGNRADKAEIAASATYEKSASAEGEALLKAQELVANWCADQARAAYMPQTNRRKARPE